MPDGRGGKCEENSGDDNGNPEQEQAGDHEKCDACDQAKDQQPEHNRRRTRLPDDDPSHAIMLIDTHPHSDRPAARMLVNARWDDFGLRAGLFWRSIVHRHGIMWVVQRQNAMHEFCVAIGGGCQTQAPSR